MRPLTGFHKFVLSVLSVTSTHLWLLFLFIEVLLPNERFVSQWWAFPFSITNVLVFMVYMILLDRLIED